MKIVPMRDLKDTVKIEKMCSEIKALVFVTINGYGTLAVMDIECFERLMNEVYEAKAINDGLKDLENDNTKDGKLVLNEMKVKYGF
jgi:hypothetical protein